MNDTNNSVDEFVGASESSAPVEDISKNEVVLVVSDNDSSVSPGQPPNARGTLGLCPPRGEEVVSVVFDDTGGEDDVNATPTGTCELPEALRLLDLVGTDDDPYKQGGKWSYAEDLGGRCFFVTQDVEYLDTGLVLLSEDRINHALSKKGMTEWAWIKHDRDTYTEEDLENNPSAVLGVLKAEHFHIVIWRKSFASVGVIARAFGVPPQQVEPKPEGAFLDLVEYLTHEHPDQIKKGKALYSDDEVHANFGWRAQLDEHKRVRASKAKKKSGGAKLVDELMLAVMHGEMTLKQVRDAYPVEYGRNLDKFKKWRGDFLLSQEPPRLRINHYIGGKLGETNLGRTGKTQLARLMARALYPHLEAAECYHEAKDKRVPLQNYRGQPVIIWDDYGPVDLMDALGGRTGVWQVFDDHPGVDDVNIKYGSVRLVHEVNIITRVTPYREYLDSLAGQYTDRFGEQHHAEDKRQAYGRFPFVHEVTSNEIGVFVNKGFVTDTREFYEFQKLATMRASMQVIGQHLDTIENEEDRELARIEVGNHLLGPLLEQHHALQPVADRQKNDVLADLVPKLEVYTGDDMARDHEQQMLQKLVASGWANRFELLEHVREFHLEGLETGDPTGFILFSGRTFYCNTGHPYVELLTI